MPLYYQPVAEPVGRSSRDVRVLVTGGTWLHRVARRRSVARRGTRAGDLRSRAIAVPPSDRGEDRARGHRRPRRRAPGSARAATRSSISRRSPTSARSSPTRFTPTGSNVHGTQVILEAARHGGIERVRLRQHGLGLRQRAGRAAPLDERRVARAARAPLHRDQARRRDVLPLVLRALRRIAHDPALRHPVRAARAARRGRACLRRTCAGRQGAHDRGRRAADAAVRLRRGPGRRDRRGAGAAAPQNRVYNLVGDEQTSVRQIADTVRELVAPVPIVHGPERPADVHIAQISGARATDELGVAARDAVRRRRQALRRVACRDERLATRGDGVEHGRATAATVLRQEPTEL